jgi:hypothetical protein
VAALVAACYGPSVGNDFVWDDRLTALAPLDLTTVLTQRTASYYRPVVMLSFAADRFLWGASPVGYHVTNVAYHLIVCWLLLGLCRALGLGSGIALAAALAFACHPVQSEAVLYISGRTDLLAGLFVLLALHAWRRARTPWDSFAFASGAALLAALLCKEAAVAVPLALLARGTHPARPAPPPVVPVASAALWLVVWVATAQQGLAVAGMFERLPAAGVVGLTYVRLLLWPSDLHLERFVAVGGWPPATVLLAWVVLATITAGLVLAARRVAGGPLWLALFFAAYAPVSGLVPVYGAVADRAVFAPEHFLYLPLLGLAPLVVAAIAACWPSPFRRLAPAALGACLLAWGWVTLDRARDWRDEETLFRHTLRYEPPAARVWFNLGNLRLAAGDLAEAERLFRAAVTRAPRDAAVHLNLGIALQRRGRFAEAEEHYRAVIRLDPQQHEAYRGLAGLLLRRGDATQAHRLLRQADESSAAPGSHRPEPRGGLE